MTQLFHLLSDKENCYDIPKSDSWILRVQSWRLEEIPCFNCLDKWLSVQQHNDEEVESRLSTTYFTPQNNTR